MARGLAAVALAGVLAVAAGCGSGVQKPAIRIVSARVIGPNVILKVKISGWSDQPTYGILTEMPVGTFRVWVALARTDFSLVYPLIRSQKVTVRVGGGKLYSTATE